MDRPTWQRVRSVFDEVASLREEERATRLDELCADEPEIRREVESLLAHDQSTDTVVERPISAGAEAFVGGRFVPGTVVSDYRIVRLLGHGGMGEVYAARQTAPIRRDVALKVIKAGMDTRQVVERFDAERQALARMDHPNISRVFDAGTTPDGRPFFAMELVEGTPITEFCDSAGLGTEQRLRLFIDVCQAIQHAHQKGVIHRDLKPSNILVAPGLTSPVVKVIDFGIAKALIPDEAGAEEPRTQIGQIMGTPDYMSPEQADLESSAVDTRTDVYSLGVVLYELLVGEVPIRTRRDGSDVTPLDRARVLRETEAQRPSVAVLRRDRDEVRRTQGATPELLARRYRRDLDWVVLEALAKEQHRRYDGPGELAADLERTLRDEPISARPPSRAYRVRKFARRHRAGVVAATVALMALVAGAVAATWGLVQARRAEAEALHQAERALQESRTAERVSSFLVDLFDAADPFSDARPDMSARELLDQGAAQVDRELSAEPAMRARMLVTLSDVYEGLGALDEAQRLAAEAVDIHEGHATSAAEEVRARNRMVDVTLARGDPEAAMEQARRSVELARGQDDPEVLGAALSAMGSALVEAGHVEEAIDHFDRALDALERSGDPEAFVGGLYSSVQALLMGGRLVEAEERLRRVMEQSTELYGEDYPRKLSMLGGLGEIVVRQGRYGEAEELLRESLELTEERLSPDHVVSLRARGALAALLLRQGNPAEARELLEESLEVAEEHHADNRFLLANFHNDLGKAHEDLGDLEEAREHVATGISLAGEAVGEEHPFVAFAINNLGSIARKQGRLDEALRLHQRSLEMKRRLFGGDHPTVISSLRNLGMVAIARGDDGEGEAYYREALALAERLGPAAGDQQGSTLQNLAALLEDQGRMDEAAELRARLEAQ